jgi:isopentenyldiphosphate isomerase
LLQRRSLEKALEPGCWDLSCAEHLGVGESYLDGAVRGLQEELDITAQPAELHLVRDTYLHETEYPAKVVIIGGMCD